MGRQPKDLSVADFAELIGYTPARVYQLIQDGMPHRMRGKTEKSARVVVADVWRWALDERKREAAKPVGPTPDPEGEARIRKRQLEADLKELELAEARRRLVPIEDFDEFTTGFLGAFSAFVTGQLQRFEPEMVRAATPAEARRLTQAIHRDLMTAARNYADELDVSADAIERAAEEAQPEPEPSAA